MIIAVANQKGGVGKTATAHAIATGATSLGKKSLAVDLDAQGNLSFCMGGNSADAGIYELLTKQATPGQTIQKTKQGDILVASSRLTLADTEFSGDDRLYALRNVLKPLRKKYDVITIDCPPALNVLSANALVAADKVIIPLTADTFALQGLYQLVATIRDAQKVNPALVIGGVVLTRYSARTIITRDITKVLEETCERLDVPLYKTTIPEGVAIREAQTLRESIFDYAPKSRPVKAYAELVNEILLTE